MIRWLPLCFMLLVPAAVRAESACLTMTLEPGHVRRVIDGDTFTLYAWGVPPEKRVRVLGVDTPERTEAGYFVARDFTYTWLMRGSFEMTTCADDSFGRALATVSRDGQTLAQALKDAQLSK